MRKSILLAAASVGAILAANPVQAQESDDSPKVQNGDIIVTARKRQESVLKVPVVETVITPEMLENRQVTSIDSITQQVTGLQIGNNVLTVGAQISLRGVGTSSLDAGVDQSVSLNIDGLQLTQGASYSVGFFDMAQIEVLKGPQALFYGKNSPGGVIAIHTADPGDEVELIARASYGFQDRQKGGELIMSAPLGDTLGIRVASMYQKDDGYFINKATALPGTGAVTPKSRRYNGGDEYIVRGTLVWKPVYNFSARLKMNTTQKEVIGGSAPIGSCPDGNGAPAGIPFINPADDCKVDRTVYVVDVDPAAFPEARNNGVPFMKYKTNFGTLELRYDLESGISIDSTTGYYHTEVNGMLNGVNSGYAGPSLIADNQFKRRDFTQEIRIESDFASPLNFLVGGFYQDSNVSNRVIVAGNLAYFVNPAFTTLAAGINDVSIKAKSAFGQLRYKPVETLEIAAGARYTDEKRHDDASSLTGINATPTPVMLANPTLRSKNWSPELTVTFTPTDDLTVFGALKQGYKSGSFIMTAPPYPGQDNSFGDERVRGGEVGVKARLADRSLLVNTAFYYYKYSDLQVGANEVAAGGIPQIHTINAGKSKVYGVDFDLTYRPPSLEGLTANFSVNWNHARFTDFPNAPCWGGQRIEDGCDQLPYVVTDPAEIAAGNYVVDQSTGDFIRYSSQSLAGLPLPKAPTWSINAGLDYNTDIGRDYKIGFGGNVQYSSKFLTNPGKNRPDFYQEGFAKFNAHLNFGAQNDAWSVSLIGNNIFNKFTTGNCTNFSGATGQIFLSPLTGLDKRNAAGVDETACIPDRGREVFLRLTLRPTAW